MGRTDPAPTREQDDMNITVYCGSSHGSSPDYAEAARELGAWIAANGHALVYGGSAVGLMGIVSDSVLAGGGEVTGVEPRFFLESGIAHHEITHLIPVDTMSERKARMIDLGDAFVALPGGMGTLEEISEIMSRIRLRLTAAPCVFLNIGGFYDELRDFIDKLFRTGFVDSYEYESVHFAPSVAEACAFIESWELDREAYEHRESIYG